MRFKSAKRFWLTGAGSALAVAALFGATEARATMTISIKDRTLVSGASASANGAYFAAEKLSVPVSNGNPVDTDAGYKKYDVDQTAVTESGSYGNEIQLLVYSDKELTIPTGQIAMILVTALPATNGSAETPIPIRVVDTSNSLSRFPYNTTYSLGARYPGTKATIKIGLYPKDICSFYNQVTGGFSAVGCDSGNPATVNLTTNGTVALNLKAYLILVDEAASGASGTFPTFSTNQDSSTLNLNFTAKGITVAGSCPDFSSNSGIYFPGDSEIKLQTDKIVSSALFTQTTGSIDTILVSRVDYGAGPASIPTRAGSQAVSRVRYGGEQTITGLINTSSDGTHVYGLNYAARDSAGMIGDSSCGTAGVQASEIAGFLKKGNCFIATAAFRSYDAAPVEMLRQFRNQVLLRFDAGRAFVSWYYSWSPRAAEWLMENPEFRFPVLMALLPLQALAWLALHPTIWVMLLSLVIIAAVAAKYSHAVRGGRRRAAR